jgi:tetratricopeptide (TPR) repeat protein
MKNFKLLTVLLVATIILGSCGLNRMIRGYGEGITYNPETNPLENHGGEIAVNISGRVSERYFNPRARVEITPVLVYEGGEQELNTIHLRGERIEGEGTRINRRTSTEFNVSDVITFQPGMEASELYLRARVYRDGRENRASSLEERKVADGVVMTSQRIEHAYDIALAPHGYEEVTTVSVSANIFFAYMNSNINWRLPLNRRQDAQQRIERLTEFINRGWEIQSIEVNAWASPEGEVAYNERLSENRARATQTYVNDLFRRLERQQRRTINRPELSVNARGEDFEGFMKVLNASDLRDKQTIANIINSQIAPAERERRIKDMTVVYAEIERLLEELRRGEIVITSFEPKRSNEEIARLSTSNPSELTVAELLFAATLTQDRQTQLSIFRSAQQLFPQDFRGFNNAAYINILNGNIDAAANELERANQLAPNNGYVLNNLGVIAANRNDFENAQSYFEAAQGSGIRVNYNLGVLMIPKGDYQAALSSFAGRTCTHNVALAHLMSGNENAALQNLECAEATGHVAYLRAVIGARRENNNMVFENLRRAVQLNPELRERATNDREFIRYFQMAEFQEAVR